MKKSKTYENYSKDAEAGIVYSPEERVGCSG